MEFFAGANTRNGFVSLFDDALKNVKQLYILKGSSGCGKSTLMRKALKKAKSKGIEADIIYCSADPDSLDGVIFPSLGVAIADGTAPHILDVKYPCVRENIINLGQFWNENKIFPYSEKIIDLTNKKSNHFKNAYKCLSAAGVAEDTVKSMISRCIDKEKMDAFAFKLAEKLITGRNRKNTSIFSTAFTSTGVKELAVFGNVDLIYRISGKASEFFILSFERIAKEYGADFITSLTCTNPNIPDAIFFPDSNTLITTLTPPPILSSQEEKMISTLRFVDSTALSEIRSRLKTLDQLVFELNADAQKELYFAKAAHNDIESIYIPAMDFSALDDYVLSLFNKIFGE